MNKEEKRTLIEQYIDAYNNFDVQKMLTVIHTDIEFVNISDGKVTASASGIDQFHQMALQSKNLFASRKQRIIRFFEKDNEAVVDLDYEGVFAIDLPNGIKAGESLHIKGCSEFVFKDGKIFRITDIAL